ncbi:uncharacterized protein LOC123525456 isoform X2 [Mercenaria mercenaria]|uniref:uncharacterized protein LOC123525456 isoform X2 n=1 Tax=Mercenaria mercenaria TaxID=6596 RepID=UPI00234E7298|nr:uncharacterized protein LOC123525456 isoform X2 [Mercenaria mercenaria]
MECLKLLIVVSIFNAGQLEDICKSHLKTNDSKREYMYDDTIHFNCEVLNKTNIDRSFFFLWHKSSNAIIPVTNTTGNTGFIDVKVVSEETGGYYSCRYGNCTVDSLLTLYDVKIDKRSIPLKNGTEVPDMKCRVIDYNMTCDWTVSTDHIGNTTWKVLYKSEGMDRYKCCTANRDEDCHSTGSRRQCFIPNTCFFIPYYITLAEISEVGTHLYHYTVLPDNTIAIVNIEDNVTVKPGETPYKLVVGFTLHRPPISVGGMKCDISYESNQEHAIVGNSTHNMYQKSLDVNITLDQLSPFTLYTVDISCKPQFSPYWSNHVSGTGRTKPLEPTAAKKMNKSKIIAIATSCSVIICLLIFVIISFFRRRVTHIIKNNTVSDEIMDRILQDSPDNLPAQSNSSSLTDDQTNFKSLQSQQVRTNAGFELPTPQMEMHLRVPTSELSKSMSDDYLTPATNFKKHLNEGHGLFATQNKMATGQISAELSIATIDGNLHNFGCMRDESQDSFVRENVKVARGITTNLDNPCKNATCHLACDSDDLPEGEYNKAVCLSAVNSAILSSNGYLEAQRHVVPNNISSTWHTFDTDDGHPGTSNSQVNDSVDVSRRNESFGQTFSSCDEYVNPRGDEDVDSNLTNITEYQRAEASRTFWTGFSSTSDMHSNNSENSLTSYFAGSNVATSGATVYNESLDEYHKVDNTGQTGRDEVMVVGSTETVESVEMMGTDMGELSATINRNDNEIPEADSTTGFRSRNGQRHYDEKDVKMVEICVNDNGIHNSLTTGRMDTKTTVSKKDEYDKHFSMKDIKKALDSIGKILECDDDQELESPFDSYAMADIDYQNDSNFTDTTVHVEDYVTMSSQ